MTTARAAIPRSESQIEHALEARALEAVSTLRDSIRHQSVSGQEGEFTRWLARTAAAWGLEVDLWQSSEPELERAFGTLPPHKSLADRPALVVRLPGTGNGPNLVFNAHSDVVPAPRPEEWTHGPWSGREVDGVVYGRGACDTKGPLVAALWAMAALASDPSARLGGDVLLEVVPGEEDCVGLGTMTSVLRGYRADASVVLEPTGNTPRCASRGGCRFEIETVGRSVHGTVKWLGIDAIELMRGVQATLSEIESRWNDRDADPLFDAFPIARPVTVDQIHGGEWQGMVSDRCRIGGYLELLPRDDAERMMKRFAAELQAGLAERGVGADRFSLKFTERYAGHREDPNVSSLCEAALSVMSRFSEGHAEPLVWTAFNSGCEAGVRPAMHRTPTLVWGPGALALAHAVDERITIREVRVAAEMFARLAMVWCNGSGVPSLTRNFDLQGGRL